MEDYSLYIIWLYLLPGASLGYSTFINEYFVRLWKKTPKSSHSYLPEEQESMTPGCETLDLWTCVLSFKISEVYYNMVQSYQILISLP